jgi:hypothetical protein
MESVKCGGRSLWIGEVRVLLNYRKPLEMTISSCIFGWFHLYAEQEKVKFKFAGSNVAVLSMPSLFNFGSNLPPQQASSIKLDSLRHTGSVELHIHLKMDEFSVSLFYGDYGQRNWTICYKQCNVILMKSLYFLYFFLLINVLHTDMWQIIFTVCNNCPLEKEL